MVFGTEYYEKVHIFFLFSFQTVIDGFDPDKFRKVNSKPTNAGTSNSAPTVSIGRNDFGSSTASMDVPGAVPTYDTTEQQLLASIEHELGVI